MDGLIFRPGSEADSETVYKIFARTIQDLVHRTVEPAGGSDEDPAELAAWWQKRQPLFTYLAQSANQFWVAEQNGSIIGYARAILRDGVQELTEFFVLPGTQSTGVGKALIQRAFPQIGVWRRAIIATNDERAASLYLKAGVYGRFPVRYFSRPPRAVRVESDLEFLAVADIDAWQADVARIDREIIGHNRMEDHRWLASHRQAWMYRRNDQVVGYGYTGESSSPFALMEENDFPAVLAHAESQAVGRLETFGVETPLINRAAIGWMLENGYRMDPFAALFMSDQPFGRFENYLFCSPPFFI